MSIKDEVNWERIERFVGYGRIDAPVMFVGIEEGLAKPRDCTPEILEALLDADLLSRSRFETDVMDLEEAHRDIVDGSRLFSSSPRGQSTWRVMADIMMSLDGTTSTDALERSNFRRDYRTRRLGRRDGDSLLVEIFPYPHPKRTDWLYKRFGHYLTRSDYERAILPRRIELLTKIIEQAPRRAIICYGKGPRVWDRFETWEQYKLLFPGAQWEDAGGGLTSDWRGARVVLCDHFATKAFNTDQQLDAFARLLSD